MTSAVSNHGAASSAKRIMSTAPIAKFGATMQLLAANRCRSSSSSSALKPVVPTTACTSCIAHHRRLPIAASATVKSTATSACASARARGRSRDDDTARDLLALVERIDRGDELDRRVGVDRGAHRRTHAPAGTEHSDADRHPRHATHRGYGHRGVSGDLRRDRARPTRRDHGTHRRGRHLSRARRALAPIGARAARRRAAARRPPRRLHGESEPVHGGRVGGAALGPLRHDDQQLPHGPRGRLHRQRLRGDGARHIDGEGRDRNGADGRTRHPGGAHPAHGRRGARRVRRLRRRARSGISRSAGRRDHGRGDALLVGHHWPAEGREAAAPDAGAERPRSGRARGQVRLRMGRRHDLPLPSADVPRRAARVLRDRATVRRHCRHHGALRRGRGAAV